MRELRVTWLAGTVMLVLFGAGQHVAVSQTDSKSLVPRVYAALSRAGDNRPQLERALKEVASEHRAGMQFLIAYMPEKDLKSLSADYLLENVRYAYQAWNQSAWKEKIPVEVFLNNVLPYASITEQREEWRKQFCERFSPLVKDAKSPGEAAAILNRAVFGQLKVKYSTQRKRADQGPLESMESGLASCTGLSVILIDACRSVGVPARFVGTPLWSDGSGNHSWVEVWDNGWHFTGAAEPTGKELDRAWFLGRASKADRDKGQHAIYAVSYKKTPLLFPMVWAPDQKGISAVNVTDRYTLAAKKLADGMARVMFVATLPDGSRCGAAIQIRDSSDKLIFKGRTNDERFDRNDHVTVELKIGQEYRVEFAANEHQMAQEFQVAKENKLISATLSASDE